MQRYKLILSYDGTQYCGWQVQSKEISIQAVIQQCLKTILRVPIGLSGAGRTDAGVHAEGQVAHFDCSQIVDLPRFLHSLNSLLPLDIRAHSVTPVDNAFHSRYSALRKVYHYHLNTSRIGTPFYRLYSYHYPYFIDLSSIRQGALLFLGTHDFKAFAHAAHRGVAARDSIRTLYRLDVMPTNGGLRFEFEGDGFLHKMVRNIVGTLIELGNKKRAVESILKLLNGGERSQAGSTAPPQGLFLVSVVYAI